MGFTHYFKSVYNYLMYICTVQIHQIHYQDLQTCTLASCKCIMDRKLGIRTLYYLQMKPIREIHALKAASVKPRPTLKGHSQLYKD